MAPATWNQCCQLTPSPHASVNNYFLEWCPQQPLHSLAHNLPTLLTPPRRQFPAPSDLSSALTSGDTSTVAKSLANSYEGGAAGWFEGLIRKQRLGELFRCCGEPWTSVTHHLIPLCSVKPCP